MTSSERGALDAGRRAARRTTDERSSDGDG